MWQAQSGRLLFLAVSLFALALAARGVVLAAPTAQLIVGYTDQGLPTEPDDPAWDTPAAVDVPLIPQASVTPALANVSIASARLRALHDGQSVAFLVEWADPTRDTHATRPDQFRDAVALQFGIGNVTPALCMGAPGGSANLWHWKADWQEDIDRGFQELPQAYQNFWKDYYPFVNSTPPYNVATDFTNVEARKYLVGQSVGNALSQTKRNGSVEELLAAGFGTATTKAIQNVSGKGVSAAGKWRVVFTRPLAVQDADAPRFTVGNNMSVAVAVWNGSNREVGGRKQISSFVTFALGSNPSAQAPLVRPAESQRRPDHFQLGLVVTAAVLLGLPAFTFLLGRWRP